MILQALYNRYENLANEGKLPLEGWSDEKIYFGLRLNEAGELVAVEDLRKEVEKGKKKVLEPDVKKVPERIKRSSGVAAQFLCDNSSYFLGTDNKGKPERSLQCFKSAKEKHLKILENCNSKTAVAIKNFFNNWNVKSIENCEVLQENLDEIKKGSNLIFMFEDKWATEEDDIKNAWLNSLNKVGSGEKKQCLISGNLGTIARIHPSIKGVRDANPSGANIIAFNKGNPAFESYGNQDAQGLNAPVSEYAAFAYTTALNNLLANKDHKQFFGDTTVVYWAEKSDENYQNAFDFFAFGDDENEMDDNDLNMAMKAIKNGDPIDYNGDKLDAKTPFYILGLSPNNARISIRFFLQFTFGDMLKNIITHHKNMEIVSPRNNNKLIPVRKLKDSLVPSKSNDNLSPVLAGAILKSILTGGLYPASLFAQAMMRTHSEQDYEDTKIGQNFKISYERCAIIKAYLIRNYGREITVALNEEEKDTAYVLGRIFAVWEIIQKKSAEGEINATIKDKYFNSFSATPAKVFPILSKLSGHHLKKFGEDKKGIKIYYEKMITELMNKIDANGIPKILPLEEQGMFVLGYYHQVQKLYTKKSEEEI